MPHSLPAEVVTAGERPDGVATVLARVVRRQRVADWLTAGAVACAVAAIGVLAGASAVGWGIGVVAAALMYWQRRTRRTAAAAARQLERAHPSCRNVVITAEELLRHPERASPWIRARVLDDASRSAEAASDASVVPLARPVAMFAVLLLAIVPLQILRPSVAQVLSRPTPGAARDSAAEASHSMKMAVTVTPPSYTGRPPIELPDPERVEAIAGSAVRLTLTDGASGWTVRYGARVLPLVERNHDAVAETTLAESGYFAIERVGDKSGGQRRLIPVAVTPDRAPVIRLEAPGRDLLLPDARPTVEIGVAAADDLGLQTLELRYTKVSGSGEQFEFQEGVLPLEVTRESGVKWSGRSRVGLTAMKLAPGDAIVYRAVGRDRRPGDEGLSESDTFFIEIAGPGQVALEGFGMPPDQERYALSQQMIVLKIQRLRARERSMTREAVGEATAGIAAEQRAVRSNFVFLMGGHVEDEEEEAERSSDIAEGRLQSSARQEIAAAVTFMSKAEQGLAAADTGAALPPAKAAVEALQRAFGRARYLLRTLPTRSRLDPSRRLTGELSAAGDWRRDPQPPAPDRETADARALFSALLDVAATVTAGRQLDPPRLTSLAEQALAVDPASPVWQQVARRIVQVRDTAPGGSQAAALAEAIAPVAERARHNARPPSNPGTRAPGSLRSAWAAEPRR